MVYEVLSHGKERAIPSKVLAAALGFNTERELRKQIENERRAGAVILSTTLDGGGYYLPANDYEVSVFIQTLKNRAKNTLRSVESAEKYLLHLSNDGTEGSVDHG